MFDLVCQLKSRVFVTFPKTWTSVWGWEWEVDNTYRRGLQELHTTRHASDSMEMKKAGRKRATKRCIIWWSRSHWLALGWLSVFDVWKETLTARCSVCKISLMTGWTEESEGGEGGLAFAGDHHFAQLKRRSLSPETQLEVSWLAEGVRSDANRGVMWIVTAQ